MVERSVKGWHCKSIGLQLKKECKDERRLDIDNDPKSIIV